MHFAFWPSALKWCNILQPFKNSLQKKSHSIVLKVIPSINTLRAAPICIHPPKIPLIWCRSHDIHFLTTTINLKGSVRLPKFPPILCKALWASNKRNLEIRYYIDPVRGGSIRTVIQEKVRFYHTNFKQAESGHHPRPYPKGIKSRTLPTVQLPVDYVF